MEIVFLGTGHGTATECYNTCFAIKKENEYFLVDSGGGNGILKQLKQAEIDLEQIRYIFISHSHMDHILGCLWLIRVLCKKYFKCQYTKPIYILGNDVVVDTLTKLCNLLIPKDFLYLIGDKIKIEIVNSNQEIYSLAKKVKFFDINAKKIKQFGFSMEIDQGKVFTFIGDEACSEETKKYLVNSYWLFADAYMAGEEAEKDNPIEKHHHSSVKYIANIAEKSNVKNLILSHTMDNNLENRKKIFTEDAKKYYHGNVYIPNDLEKMKL